MGKATYRFVYYHDQVALHDIEFGTMPASKKKTTNKHEYKGEATDVELEADGKLEVYIKTSGPVPQSWELYVEYEDLIKKELKTYPIERTIGDNGYTILNLKYALKP